MKTAAFWLAFFAIALAVTLGADAVIGNHDGPVTCDQPAHCEDPSGPGPGNGR